MTPEQATLSRQDSTLAAGRRDGAEAGATYVDLAAGFCTDTNPDGRL